MALAAGEPLVRLERDIAAIVGVDGPRSPGTPKSRAGSTSLGVAIGLALLGGATMMGARRAAESNGRSGIAAARSPLETGPAAKAHRPPPLAHGSVGSDGPAPLRAALASAGPTTGRSRPPRDSIFRDPRDRSAPGRAAGPDRAEPMASVVASAPRPAPPLVNEVPTPAFPLPDRFRADPSPVVLAAFSTPRFPPGAERSSVASPPAPPVREKPRARRESVDALLTLRRQW